MNEEYKQIEFNDLKSETISCLSSIDDFCDRKDLDIIDLTKLRILNQIMLKYIVSLDNKIKNEITKLDSKLEGETNEE